MSNMWEGEQVQAPRQSTRWFSNSSTTELIRYWEAILKRWPIVVSILLSVLFVGIIYTLSSPKLYRATSTIVISPYTPQILTGVQDFMPDSGARFSDAFLRTEHEILESRTVAMRAVDKLNLRNDDRNNGLGKISDPKQRELARQNKDWASFVQSKIKINPERRSFTVDIEAVDTDPKFAASLANGVAAAYMELNIEKRGNGAKEAAGWLASQHEELRGKLDASQALLYDFMAKHQIANATLPGQMEEIKSRLTQFNTKLAEAQSLAIANQVEAEEFKRIFKHPELVDSLPGIQNHRMIGDLKNKLTEARTRFSELSGKYLPAHPAMRSIRDQVESLEKNLKTELEAAIRKIERENQSLQRTQDGLQAAINAEKEREGSTNKLSLEYDRLKRESDTNEQLYNMVTGRMKEINLSGLVQSNNIHMLTQAEAPKQKYSPSWSKNLLIALALGLFLGIGYAILIDLLDNTIKSQEDVEKYLHLPFLGSMPVIIKDEITQKGPRRKRASPEKMRERDLYSMLHPSSMAAECARAVRTNLIFMSPEKPLQSMVITSAIPKEGKTTTACNLAATMAQGGARVVLIDGDMRKPRLHSSFSLDNDKGLSSYIVGEDDIDSIVKKTALPSLDVITSGPIPPNPSELIHTARFKEFIAKLEQRYDRVIFDAPPVNSVTDPVILGKQVGGVTLVVKVGGISYQEVQRAVSTLLDARVVIYGVVLNDLEISKGMYNYRYYRYGKYYGNYARDPISSAPEQA